MPALPLRPDQRSFIPFPESEAEDDSRRPLSERYADEQEWRAAVQAAAEDLVAQDLVLRGDIPLVTEGAAPGLSTFRD